MQRLNPNRNGKGGEKKNNTGRNHYNYDYNHNHAGSSGGRGRRTGRSRQGGGAAAVAADDDGFGEFPPPSLVDDVTPEDIVVPEEIATPQIRNGGHREAPQSRIRFAEDTRLSPTRPSVNRKVDHREALVLDGRRSDRRHGHGYDGSASASAALFPSASKMSEASSAANLDFSMITTPGGKIARMVDDASGLITPSEANAANNNSYGGRWGANGGTPFSSILRGVVSSTPSINPRQILASNGTGNTPSIDVGKTPYTAARESLNTSLDGDDDGGIERTAAAFARSAPLSGYLRKLGRNVPAFKRRFFVLKPSTHLYYFVSPNDVEPRGCIDLDTVHDGGGGCEVREIGTLPDGTFRFELLFDEEEDDDDGTCASTDTSSRASSSQNSKRRNFRRQTIVLEARTEEMGREWMDKLQSERLSAARGEAEYLGTNLAEMRSISSRWETSACEEAMRADRAERQRNAAISEAKGWERKFTDLNEAIRSLAKDDRDAERGGNGRGQSKAASSSSEFLTEALAGLDVEGTYFGDISRVFREIRTDYDTLFEREEKARERVNELERRAREAELRAARAESELANVWEDNRMMQNDLKTARREKKILVKEVRSWHATAATEEDASRQSSHSKQSARQHHDRKQPHHNWCMRSGNSNTESSRGGTTISQSDGTSNLTAPDPPPKPKPKRKTLSEEDKRLVIELEEHVMSGLRLSEQFLTLNGIDPCEVGDDLDDSVQASSVQTSIHQASGSVQAGKPKLDKSLEPQSKACGFSPQRALLDISSPGGIREANTETARQHHVDNPLGSLFDESEDAASDSLEATSAIPVAAEEEIDRAGVIGDATNMSYTADTTQGSIFLNEIHHYPEEVSGSADNSINRNLHERFREQITPIGTLRQEEPMSKCHDTQPASHTEEKSANRALPLPLPDVPSSNSKTSSSIVTDNGNIATSKLECTLKDVGETPLPKPSDSAMGEDGKVYHISFYSKKIGLQFQKVPNETATPAGLLTEAMTADHGPNVESNQTVAELRRISSISQHNNATKRQQGGRQAMECLPIAPDDAVLVCGFAGFDASTGNIRPRIGARLVAFDGMTVEVGQWTFESIRKSIQARGRPLTLSFRNDFLTPNQRAILTEAIEDVKPPIKPPPHNAPRGKNAPITRERLQDHHHHQSTINTVSTTSSSLSSQFSSQPPKSNKYYSSFSEAGSSISSAVAPLMSNLLSNSRGGAGKQQGDFAPDYLRRTSDSLDKMRHHHDFQSGLL